MTDAPLSKKYESGLLVHKAILRTDRLRAEFLNDRPAGYKQTAYGNMMLGIVKNYLRAAPHVGTGGVVSENGCALVKALGFKTVISLNTIEEGAAEDRERSSDRPRFREYSDLQARTIQSSCMASHPIALEPLGSCIERHTAYLQRSPSRRGAMLA